MQTLYKFNETLTIMIFQLTCTKSPVGVINQPCDSNLTMERITYLPTVPILTQDKVGKGAILPHVPIFAKICLYRKFRNVPIFEDFSPICPYFLVLQGWQVWNKGVPQQGREFVCACVCLHVC